MSKKIMRRVESAIGKSGTEKISAAEILAIAELIKILYPILIDLIKAIENSEK